MTGAVFIFLTCVFSTDVKVFLNQRNINGSSSEVFLVQNSNTRFLEQESSQACGISKHLVKRETNEGGLYFCQVKSITGEEGGSVQEDKVLAGLLEFLHPAQRVFLPIKVGHRGETE